MIEIDPSRWRQDPPPWRHQIVGASAIVKRPAFFVGDVPRIGKSRQVVDAACILADAGQLDLVVVVAPESARIVWGDKELGQVKRYSWKPARVVSFHQKVRTLWTDENPGVLWLVTNYDFIRIEKHLENLIEHIKDPARSMIVFDESSAVGNHTSMQSKAMARLRKEFGRCVMLNGTPGEPPKLWSQFNILDDVLSSQYKNYQTYRWRYVQFSKEAVMVPVKGRDGKPGGIRAVHQEIGWKNLDKLGKILAPWCIRRERKDCPELRDIQIIYGLREVPLLPETWRMYQELKKEALIFLTNALGDGEVYMSPNANTRLLRLAQITSGHLGGFETGEPIRELSSEKIDWMVNHILTESTAENFIIWCRWVREREMLAAKLKASGINVWQIHGGQAKAERRIAEMIFADGAVREPGRHAMLAQPQAGGVALDMSAATEVFRLSNDYSLRTLEQSGDRPLGQAQKNDFVPCTDVLACGPNMQRTVDHVVVAALREKRDIAKITLAEWKKELSEEDE